MAALASLFSIFLKSGIAATVFILIAMLLRQTVLKKITRHLMLILWVVVLAKLLIPVSISSPVSIFNHTPAFNKNTVLTRVNETVNKEANQNVTVSDSISLTQDLTTDSPEQPEDQLQTPAPTPVNGRELLLQVGAIVWVCGFLVMMIVLISLVITTAKRVSGRKLLQDTTIESFFASVNCPKPRLYSLPGISSPFVFGCFRQSLIIPDKFDLQTKDLPYILQHELCHIRRHDNFWNVAALLALCLHWFNPLVWLAYILSSKDIEITCDESVLRRFGENRKADYASILLQFFGYNKHPYINWKEGLVMGIGKPSIKERIKAVIDYKHTKKIILVFSSILVLAVISIFGTNAIGSNEPKIVTPALADTEETTAIVFETTEPPETVTELNAEEISVTTNASAEVTEATAKPSTTKTTGGSTTAQITTAAATATTTPNEELQIKPILKDGFTNLDHTDDYIYLYSVKQLALWQGNKQIPNNKITWYSENEKYVSIDADGYVTIDTNPMILTVKATYNGKSVSMKVATYHATGCIPSCLLKVFKNGIYSETVFNYKEIQIAPNINKGFQLKGYIESLPDQQEIATFTSSDPSVVSVDQDGYLTGLKSGGQATITAKNSKGFDVTITVKVS